MVQMTKEKKKAKVFGLKWIFEALLDCPGYLEKRMFGALAAYAHGKMMLMIAESPGDRSYRGKSYDHDIWYGLLLPVEREKHKALRQEYESLIPHPVLPKWLYLPVTDENFETIAEQITEQIKNNDPRYGIFPKIRKNKKTRKTTKRK